jgi:putative tryptophan/tyrosine transport system substrate-binding protein
MRRRQVLTGFVAFAGMAWAGAASAQAPPKVLRLGTVYINPRTASFWAAFDRRMRELGRIEGENLKVESHDIGENVDRLDEAMQDLVRRGVDVILAGGPELVLKSALAATRDVPIVMVAVDYDPLARGYIGSLARPTGNVTGIFFQQIELSGKRLQVMKEEFPRMRAAAVLWDALSADQWQAARQAAEHLGIRVAGIELRDRPYDYEWALAKAPPEHRRFLIVMASPLFYRERDRIGQLAIRQRMASMFPLRGWVEAGGLLSYGASIDGLYRRAAEYVDRVAKGAKPAELPVEQPTKFELVVNLKTARALAIELPAALLARADEVIE